MRRKRNIAIVIITGIIMYLIIPLSLFDDPYATVLNDEHGALLSAKIAKDGQWRFPEIDSVPNKFIETILYFEDEYFYYHPGVNPVSIARALWQNLTENRIVSGGSTISMQLIRLARKNRNRSYFEKVIEIAQAIKLNIFYSKNDILKLYVSHAPYGGNVVGAEAASWRYFNRSLDQLSWAEYTTLAVLPNAPSLMHPGKNRNELEQKRNRLLKKLYENNVIDSTSYSLALMETIPEKPKQLPNEAFHLLDFTIRAGHEGERLQTTINKNIQLTLANRLDNYVSIISQNEIRNACAVVVSLKDETVKAYIGNTRHKGSGAKYVDLVQAPRSSGSILKPLLYGKAIDAGLIHTSTLLKDIPISISKFSPTNFDKGYEGVVPAGKALARSLNIPATLLLRDYGIAPFHDNLKDFGFSTISRNADNYGLTLVLGGAEVCLWDLVTIYSYQAKLLREFNEENQSINGLKLWEKYAHFTTPHDSITAGAWWLISDALTNVQRPGLDKNWRLFSSSRKIAWKTGTSHGFRDAWAIGYDSGYLVAVWVGNAEGEGRPGLTGVSVAAPLMFQMFQYLEKNKWFEKPEMALKDITLCANSGLLPSTVCPTTLEEIPINATMQESCKLHKKILLNEANQRVFMNCAHGTVADTVWFTLDPVSAYYYKLTHYNYQAIPPFAAGCTALEEHMLEVIYPHNNTEIIIPKDFNGEHETVQLEATHIDADAVLYWHINGEYIGMTQEKHKMNVDLAIGKYTLLIVDDSGNSAHSDFIIYK